MKKCKRFLSLMFAVTLVVGNLATGMTVFAEEDDGNIGNISVITADEDEDEIEETEETDKVEVEADISSDSEEEQTEPVEEQEDEKSDIDGESEDLPEEDEEELTDEENTLTYEGSDFTITVTYGADAELPENVSLTASEYDQESSSYQTRLQEALEICDFADENEEEEEGADSIVDARLFDVSLIADGKEVEPAALVSVSISCLNQEEDSKDYTVVHFGETAEMVQAENSIDDDAQTVDFSLDSFSDIMLLAYYGNAYDVVFTTSNENGVSGVNTGGYNGGSRATILASSLTGYAESDGSIEITFPSDDDLANNTGNVVTIYEPGNVTVTLNGIDNNGYDYKLEGWYDLGTGEYYAAGSTGTINLSDRNIFYADYYADSYDVGYDNGDTADSVSTNFVNVELFDYNELFNLYSANVALGTGNTGEVFSDSNDLYASPAVLNTNGTGHDADSTGISSFLFKYNSVGTSNIFYPNNMATWNEWVNGYNLQNASSTWGINSSSYTSNTLLNQLFNPSTDALGVKYIGSADYLFQYGTDDDEDGKEDHGAPDEYIGYYYYSSNLNSAAYNQNEGRFYVYNDLEPYDDSNMFLPFQDHDKYLQTGASSGNDLNVNYLFGMSMEVDFYLPNAVNGENTETQTNGVGNVDENGNDLVFSYSGDDDILVFVDDDLVLDMSGIHLEADGSINFNRGTYEKSNVTEGPGGTINLASGSHKLTVYYLERGTGYSNLTVSFNVVPQWYYKTADVQTIEASKVWIDADKKVIEDTTDLPDVNVGLYAALGEDEYDEGNGSYHFTDDKNQVHTFTYSDTEYTHSIDGTIVESSETKNDDGQFIDDNGWVLAWMDGEKLFVRVDVQVLNEENDWTYAWEMRNPEESYVVLEMESDAYTLIHSEVDDNASHYYWTIIGEAEIEGDIASGDLSNVKLILTDGAQHKTSDETLGDTLEATGWVLVADASGSLTAKEVTFSQVGTLTHINPDTGEESGDWYGTYGVTTVGQIDDLGDGAIWYMEDAYKTQDDTTGEEIEAFYLYCVINGQTYYLTTEGGETTLGVTNNKNYAREFYYDSLGELRIALSSGDTRVAIDDEGNITLEPAAEIAETSDVRIYTLTEIKTNGHRYIFVNEPDQPEDPVKSYNENTEAGEDGTDVNVGDSITYDITYYNHNSKEAVVTITDVLDKGFDFVEASDGGTYDEETRTVTWTLEDVPANSGGKVTLTVTVNENAFEIVENQASVAIGNDPAVDTNILENPVPEDEKKSVDVGDGTPVQVGDELEYTITFYNDSEDEVEVTITDTLDDGLTYVDGSASEGGEYNEESRTITWTVTLEAYKEGQVTFKATVNEDAFEVIDNEAQVTYGDNPDVTKTTNTVENPVPEDPTKDVDVGNGTEVSVGDTLVYTITYYNYNAEEATVMITDVLDEGLNFVSAEDGGTYDESTRTITWVIENAPADKEGSVSFTATVNETALVKDLVENTAVVQVGDDPAVDTNIVENPVDDPKDPDKDVNVGDGTEVSVGDDLIYTITYKNDHSVAANVIITDVLDEGLDFVFATNGGIYDKDTRTVTWTIENVSAYTEGSVYLVAKVNETALVYDEVTNSAKVQVENDAEQETKEVVNPVEDPKDPTKAVDTDQDDEFEDDGVPVSVGDEVTYEITYKNGHSEAATVTITDVLDVGLTFVSATDGGTYDEDSRTITWTLEDVEAYQDGSVTFTATVNEDAVVKDEVDNTASVQIGNDPEVDTNVVENPLEDPEDPTKGVDVGNGTEVGVGDELIYTISYKNPHGAEATVTITDVLDEGLDFVSATEGGTYDEDTRTVTWIIKNVPAYTAGTVDVAVKVNENALVKDEVDNTASVQFDHDPAVDTNEVVNPVEEPEDPTKDVDVGNGTEVKVGDDLTYTITYKNGYSTEVTVIIKDALDIGLDFVSATDGGTYDEDSRTITWTLDSVEAYAEGSVSFTATVNSDALEKEEVDNVAYVKVGDDPAVKTNEVENPVDDPKDPDKDVNVGDGTEVSVGDELIYTITYKNDHSAAADVTITDVLDAGLDFVFATDNGVYDEATHTVTWTISNVAAYTEDSVYLIVSVNENALEYDEVTNTATVQVGDDPDVAVETNEVENPVEDPEDPVKSVEIGDTEEGEEPDYNDSGKEVSVGDTLTYEITYKNGHSETATVTITDVLDVGLTFVSATDGGTYDEDTRTITWILEDVEAYGEGNVTFTATVNEDAVVKDEVDNTASVQVGDDPAVDTNVVENPLEDLEDPTKGVDVGNGTEVCVGDELIYTISYKNPHGAEATVTITDVLDEGLDFVNATEGGTYDEDTRTVTWIIENVPAYTAGTVDVAVKVNENALVKDEVDNTASVQFDHDPSVDTNVVENPIEDTDEDEEYFPLDEEIVTDENDRDTWVKSESVNEYNAIEIEMSTYLPILQPEEVQDGDYVMTFHDILDSELNLDEADADFSVYIGGEKISHDYYTITLNSGLNPLGILLFGSSGPQEDGCSFHVDVNLTKLYQDGVITDDDLTGDTEIMIFFYADLEGTELNGSYKSTVWYEVYDGDEWKYTSNVDVVEVYTYDIDILKYDTSMLDGDDYDNSALADATLALYTDKECTEPVSRNGEPYAVTSGEDGHAIFYGLAEGTYYVKETAAPDGYELSEDVLTFVIDSDSTSHVYYGNFANTPEEPKETPEPDEPQNPKKDISVGNGAEVFVGEELTYTIDYYNHHENAATVTITDKLDYALDFISATDGGEYDEDSRTVTWVIENAQAQEWGSVEVTVKVNDIALAEAEIENTANVQIDEDEPVETNKVEDPTPDVENPDNGNPDNGNPNNGNPNNGNPSGTGGNGGNGAPKTGDTNHPGVWIALMAACAVIIGDLCYIRRRRNRTK